MLRSVALMTISTILAAGCVAETDPSIQADEHAIEDTTVDTPELPVPIRVEPVHWEDEGDLCLFADEMGFAVPGTAGGTQTFEDGSKLVARVAVPGCLSASCDINRQAECEVVQKGRMLIVTSHLSYAAVEGRECTADCGILWATCESAPLEAGSYDVVFGEERFALDVPSEQAACVGVDELRRQP